MNKRTRVILMIVACWSSQSMSAETFVVEHNLADIISLGGNPVNGSFDLSSVLTNNGQYVQPYDIISAFYTFTFQDNVDVRFDYCTSEFNREAHYSYPKGIIGAVLLDHYHYLWTTYNYYVDAPESVQVDIEGQYSSDGSTAYYSTTTLTGAINDHPYFCYSYDITSGFTGSRTLTQSFGANALASLKDDGVVDFTLTPIDGDMFCVGGTLTVVIEENSVSGPSDDDELYYILMELEGSDATSGGFFGDGSDPMNPTAK